MEKNFTIDKVSWHSTVEGNTESRDQIILRFFSLIQFLQNNALLKSTLINNIEQIDDDTAISSSDLTDLGLSVIKDSYDKWLRKVDKGMSPTDTRILEKSLAKFPPSL